MKIICIGLNYKDPNTSTIQEKSEPVVFLKPDSSILPKKQPFIIPPFSKEVVHEVEVLVKIKKVGKYISPKFAHTYYDEIGLGIDFTARDLLIESRKNGLPWEKAKAFDGSAFMGDFINKNEISDLENTPFSLQKNGVEVQSDTTANMIHKIDELIAYCSQFFTLKIGDIIFTGTPAGVGAVAENDELVGYLNHKEMFRLSIK
ncbi:MAG: fumarylacetoacetate hydrolase family protein [Flavobacteriaceae bacterium]|nr:fumarylacetoacetate hydrolase family protein [Flavobacteriaceae bacterium]